MVQVDALRSTQRRRVLCRRSNRRDAMKRPLLFRTGAAALALSLMAPAAIAHHGWAGQGSETFELSGTVHSAVNLTGPHATMKVQDKQGQVWDLTLASPPRTEGAGLKAGVI